MDEQLTSAMGRMRKSVAGGNQTFATARNGLKLEVREGALEACAVNHSARQIAPQ